jgi:MarR family transcriptional regulator, organic hydroperoxide resistance regulator
MSIPSQSSSRDKSRQKTMSRKQARNGHSAADVLGRYAAPRESIGFVVRQVYRGFARSLETRIAREGVSIGMWFVLRMLWEEDGLTQRQISERVGINAPTVVVAINSMERAGIVRRAPNRDDRRKTNVFLTRRGHQLKDKLWPMAKDVYAVAFKNIDRKDIAAMGRFLAQVLANLEAERRPRSGAGH